MARFKIIIAALVVMLAGFAAGAQIHVEPAVAADTVATEPATLDTKNIIFEHLLDGYGWEVPFDHHHRIRCPS